MLTADTVVSGKYVILRPLASGGMGDIYEAYQRDLARPVAIKLLHDDVATNPAMFQRFRREAEAVASLGHPNIVQIFDFRNEPGEPTMLVMEKLEGESLRELLAEAHVLAPPRAVFIALQILSALAAAHRARIVHRDIKPANVFILKTLAVPDFVKVLDFGVAKLLEPEEGGGPALTNLGEVLGTASYMAPEQARGLTIDGRADLFAVGGILFQSLSGHRPRDLGAAGIFAAATMPCHKLREVAPFIDRGLADIVDRALSLDPHARFANAEAMAEALAPFSSQGAGERRESAPSAAPQTTTATSYLSHPGALPSSSAAVVSSTMAAMGTMLPAQAPLAHGASQPPPHHPLAAPGLEPTMRSPEQAPHIPAARPSSPSATPPVGGDPRAAASAYARVSYSSPSLPRAAPGRSSGASWWMLLLPVGIVIFVGIVFFGALIFLAYRVNHRQQELVDSARPARCFEPSTCSSRVHIGSTTYAACSPMSASRYRLGDTVFYHSGAQTLPGKLTAIDPFGAVVIGADGRSAKVALGDLLGTYCGSGS